MNNTANQKSTQAPCAVTLPSFGQLATMFMERAVNELGLLQDIRKRDSEWVDQDADVDQMLDLTFDRVLAMRAGELPSAEDFTHAWFRLSAVVNSGSKLFSRPTSWYGRSLSGVAEFFRQAPEMLEYAEEL